MPYKKNNPGCACCEVCSCAGLIFSDDFNRADSDTVGNGWREIGKPIAIQIASNRLRMGDLVSSTWSVAIAQSAPHPDTQKPAWDICVKIRFDGPKNANGLDAGVMWDARKNAAGDFDFDGVVIRLGHDAGGTMTLYRSGNTATPNVGVQLAQVALDSALNDAVDTDLSLSVKCDAQGRTKIKLTDGTNKTELIQDYTRFSNTAKKLLYAGVYTLWHGTKKAHFDDFEICGRATGEGSGSGGHPSAFDCSACSCVPVFFKATWSNIIDSDSPGILACSGCAQYNGTYIMPFYQGDNPRSGNTIGCYWIKCWGVRTQPGGATGGWAGAELLPDCDQYGGIQVGPKSPMIVPYFLPWYPNICTMTCSAVLMVGAGEHPATSAGGALAQLSFTHSAFNIGTFFTNYMDSAATAIDSRLPGTDKTVPRDCCAKYVNFKLIRTGSQLLTAGIGGDGWRYGFRSRINSDNRLNCCCGADSGEKPFPESEPPNGSCPSGENVECIITAL